MQNEHTKQRRHLSVPFSFSVEPLHEVNGQASGSGKWIHTNSTDSTQLRSRLQLKQGINTKSIIHDQSYNPHSRDTYKRTKVKLTGWGCGFPCSVQIIGWRSGSCSGSHPPGCRALQKADIISASFTLPVLWRKAAASPPAPNASGPGIENWLLNFLGYSRTTSDTNKKKTYESRVLLCDCHI